MHDGTITEEFRERINKKKPLTNDGICPAGEASHITIKMQIFFPVQAGNC